MARIVFCEYLKKEAEGLDFQLYPGELGNVFLIQSANRLGENGSKNKRCWLMKKNSI